ncbi:DUF5685 family protein [Lachnospiraceae bacterium HCP1S3_C3]
MFGYIRIQKEELKMRDYYTYNKKYCTLCHMIGKNYGFIYRMILSYDVTFLMLVLENFDTSYSNISFRCPINLRKKVNAEFSERVTEYTAFINYYLAVLKLKDDIEDDNIIIKKLALKKFMSNLQYKSVATKYTNEIQVLSDMMSNINELEKNNTSFDVLTNAFAEFFTEIFRIYFRLYDIEVKEMIKDKIYTIVYNLGKWIYMMDAYDDYIEDIKNGRFNLLTTMMQKDDSAEKINTHKKIAIMNGILIYKMKKAFNEIKWEKNGEIIDNIISYGCNATYYRILHKRYFQIEHQLSDEFVGV